MLGNSVRIVIAAGVILLLLSVPVSGDEGTVRVFYYGLGDGYFGEKHSAAWHRETPENWPDVVDLVHYGIATSDHSIPFGTILCLEAVAYPAWAEGEYDHLIGASIICGTVVDRMPRWVEQQFGPCIDIWPAMARMLIGSDYRRVGTIQARVVQGDSEPGRWTSNARR